MLKRTIYIGNPSKLRLEQDQLRILQNDREVGTVPVEDLGVLVIDHPQLTLTAALMRRLAACKTVVLFCDESHHPAGIYQSLVGHSLMTANIQAQVAATLPLKKQLWRQTVMAKLENQGEALSRLGKPWIRLKKLASDVRSGDASNREATGAAYYWPTLFGDVPGGFRRDRFGHGPNGLLNYGYAIIRSTMAQAIVLAGLLGALGIHHRNALNPFCLADDIMEPYRPFVDLIVHELYWANLDDEGYVYLDKGLKRSLLEILTQTVFQGGKRTPLSLAIQRTATSLALCYSGEKRRISYATFEPIQ